MKKILSICCLTISFFAAHAQIPDHVYRSNIHSAKLFKYGDIFSYPIIMLNSGEQLELHFDDFDADVKNYYYTFQLCNADWTTSNLPTFDYIRGFQSTSCGNSWLLHGNFTGGEGSEAGNGCRA